jgi:hypothetical protein
VLFKQRQRTIFPILKSLRVGNPTRSVPLASGDKLIRIKRFRHIKSWHALLSILAATFRLDVRFGSKADIASSPRHVRFTPESGHPSAREECPYVPKAAVSCCSK